MRNRAPFQNFFIRGVGDGLSADEGGVGPDFVELLGRGPIMEGRSALVRDHFRAISGRTDEISQLFYKNLFTRYPQVLPMFANVTMEDQRAKLIHALTIILRNLGNSQFIRPYLQGLGLSHVTYGTESAHYDAFGESLFLSLEEVSGELWTEDVASAWNEAYASVAEMMKEGAALADKIQKEAA